MKKLFVIALAAFGMVACMNDEVTELPSGNEISFDNAFIDNATRAELTAANLGEFKVWGYIDGLGDADNQQVALFEGETVSNATGAWQYGGGARYWAPEEMHYFEAVAPLTAAVSVVADATNSGKISTIEYTVDGESDLIYAAYSKQAASANQDNGPVSFTFDHLLSRVMFTFNNGFAAEDGISLTIKNVKMTVPASGTYSNGAWTVNATNSKVLENIEGSKFVLPYNNTYAYAIEFDVDVLYKGAVINKDVHKTSTVVGVALEQGKSYNFTATIDEETLNMESIEFIIGEIEEWGDPNNVELPAALINGTPYNTIEEALANLKDGETLTLNKNVTLDTDNTQTIENKSVSIDLNGKIIRGKANDDTETRAAATGNRMMFTVKKGALSVKNGTIEFVHEGTNMGWSAMTTIFNITEGGVVELEGVTAKNMGGTDMNFVAHLNNWGDATLKVNNSTLEASYIAVRVFNSGPNMNNVSIKNSTLEGKYCFWVHNFTSDDFGGKLWSASDEVYDVEKVKERLNVDILNGTNKFEYTGKAPILVGFNNTIYVTANGNIAVNSAQDLQNVVDSANGNTNVELVADIEGDVVVAQKEDTKITIYGAEHAYKGTITVDGKSATIMSAGLTIKDLTFDAETISQDACVNLGDGTTDTRYTCNVTVENCTFDVPGAVGVKSYTGGDKKLTIKGCTATANAHSLVQAKGIDGINIEKCHLYSKNGMNFNNSTNVTITECTADVKGYAARFGESSGGVGAAEVYTIKNSTLKSACEDGDAVIILRGTADYSTLTIEKTTLEGALTITNNATDAKVIIDGQVAKTASTQEELKNAIEENAAIVLGEGEFTIPSEAKGKTLTISGTKDTKIDVSNGLTYVQGADITFEGVTIQSKPDGLGYNNGFADLKDATFNHCVINGTIGLDFSCEFNYCEFNIEGNYYNVWTWGAGTATFNYCTFNCDGKALLVYANVLDNGTTHQTINISDCTFNDNGNDTVTGKAAIEITNTYTPIRTYDVIITRTTVNGFAQTVPGAGDFNAAFGSVEDGNIGTNVWGNKCKLANTYLNVEIDGVDVY